MYFDHKTVPTQALKKGILNTGHAMWIKSFECHCSRHQGTTLKIIAPVNLQAIPRKKCTWEATGEGTPAMDSRGELSMATYNYYKQHPEWKVRAAVAMGLSKHNTEQSVRLLHSLAKDTHYGVFLSAIQSLEKLDATDELNQLQEYADNRAQRLAARALERIHFGVNPKTLGKVNPQVAVKKTLFNLKYKGLLKVTPTKRNRGHMLIFPRKIFHSDFHEARVNCYLYYRKGRLSEPKSFTFFNSALPNGEHTTVKLTRASSKRKEASHENYLLHLFSTSRFPGTIEQNITPEVGKIYWAVSGHSDPKTTRPVLVASFKESGDLLVIPLTSKLTPENPDDVTVKILSKRSRTQLDRIQVIHRSLLLSECKPILDTEPAIDPESSLPSKNEKKLAAVLERASFYHP